MRWRGVFIIAVLSWFVVAIPHPVTARPDFERRSGWHEGPFVLLGACVLNTDKDRNLLTGEKFGEDYTIGGSGIFGWNITDAIASELQVRAARVAAIFDGQDLTQWTVAGNLNARYSFLLPALMQPKVAWLPYIKSGFAFFASAVRGGSRNESKVATYGTGFDAGVGLELLIGHPALMIDLGVQEDIIFLEGKKSGPITVTASGVDPQLGASLSIGFHW